MFIGDAFGDTNDGNERKFNCNNNNNIVLTNTT